MTLDMAEALSRLSASRIAHLATVSEDGVPHLVPVTFAAWANTIVIAVDHKPKTTQNLKRLRNIRATGRAALLTDHYDDSDWTRLWWVRADGKAQVIAHEPDRTRLTDHLREKYKQYANNPPQGPVIRIHIESVHSWTYE